MANVFEFRMSEKDRERFGGEEWVALDIDLLLDEPASRLKTWEQQTGYPIERAINSIANNMPAVATQVVVWLARKQSNQNRNTPDGTAESFAALDEMQTLRVSIRVARVTVAEAEDDADPPVPRESAESTPKP